MATDVLTCDANDVIVFFAAGVSVDLPNANRFLAGNTTCCAGIMSVATCASNPVDCWAIWGSAASVGLLRTH